METPFEEFTNLYKNSIRKLYSKPADAVRKLCVTEGLKIWKLNRADVILAVQL